MSEEISNELRMGPMREFLRMNAPTMSSRRALTERRPLGATARRSAAKTHVYVHETTFPEGRAHLELLHAYHLAEPVQRTIPTADAGPIDPDGWWEVWPALFGGLRIDTRPLYLEAEGLRYDLREGTG